LPNENRKSRKRLFFAWQIAFHRTISRPAAQAQRIFQPTFTMLTLRLNRQGTKDRPFYKIVAVDSRKRRDGRYIEQIGTYNPMEDGANYTLDVDKADAWISKGAQPSDTVRDIIKKARKAAMQAEA
jgi:small subunit ribosomal protein S16